jgi:hypothetical protein
MKQWKCLVHLQRTFSEVPDRKKGRARYLAEGTRELLRFGVRLREKHHDLGGASTFAPFNSVIQTLLKKGTPSSVVEALADLFRGPQS